MATKKRLKSSLHRARSEESKGQVLPFKGRALPFFIVFVAIVGFFNALRFGSASLDYYSVRDAVDDWELNASIPTEAEFEQTKGAINTANVLHYSNPLYIDLSGQLDEWGAISGFEETVGLKQAQANYIEATKIRPLWPVTWANLVMVKWRLQEFDEEMLDYLSRANKLGPQSVEVHILFVRMGLSLFAANHPMYAYIKDTVRERLRRGLRNPYSRDKIVSFINSTKSMSTACAWMLQEEDETAIKQLACSR